MKRSFTKYPTSYVKASIDPDEAEACIVYWEAPNSICNERQKTVSYFSTWGEAYLEYKRWAEEIDNPDSRWGILKVQLWRKFRKGGDFVLDEEKVSKDF